MRARDIQDFKKKVYFLPGIINVVLFAPLGVLLVWFHRLCVSEYWNLQVKVDWKTPQKLHSARSD